MEEKWLTVPADRKPTRTVRLCVLIGLTVLALLVALPELEASGFARDTPPVASATD